MDEQEAMSAYFPRAELYMRPGRDKRLVRETLPPSKRFSHSERHLQCVWFDATWRPAQLATTHGEPVVVQTPGRWNLEAGPDFLDAVLLVGPEQRRVLGDIEVHVRPGDWSVHGHAKDPGYARVVAHVTYLPGAVTPDALPPGAVQIALRDALRTNPDFCFDCVDVTAYPYAAVPSHPTPCRQTIATWAPEAIAAFLEAAGEERLRRKACRIEAAVGERGPDQVLYEEVMGALGYKHNAIPFRGLARRVTLDMLTDAGEAGTSAAYALLLGVAGLLPAKPSARWDRETRTFIRSLWDSWWKRQSALEHLVMPASAWRRSGTRPQNHPVRRLAAAAGIFSHGASPAGALAKLDRANPARWLKGASALLRDRARMDYWDRRLSFSTGLRESPSSLIGPARLGAITSNIIVPFLAAGGNPVSPLLSELPPEQDNTLVRCTAASLLGRDHNPALYRHGLRQQGLLQVFHDFCLNNRTGCRDCGLPDLLRAAAAG